jgi:hypothetical protein
MSEFSGVRHSDEILTDREVIYEDDEILNLSSIQHLNKANAI